MWAFSFSVLFMIVFRKNRRFDGVFFVISASKTVANPSLMMPSKRVFVYSVFFCQRAAWASSCDNISKMVFSDIFGAELSISIWIK